MTYDYREKVYNSNDLYAHRAGRRWARRGSYSENP